MASSGVFERSLKGGASIVRRVSSFRGSLACCSGLGDAPDSLRLVEPRRLRRSRVALGMVLAGVLVMGVGCFERSPGQRIVLITLDTLRYDSLAAVGGRPSTMPQLERWAEQAAVFEHFYAATAATQPSHASMFTGLHPWQHGVTGNRLRLAESHATVAEHLNEAGYSTAAVVASFPVSQRFGFGQGFGYFDDEFELGTAPGEPGEDPSEEAFYTLADVVTDRALEQLTVALGRRQFFWFHYFDPHSPYGDTSGGSTIQPREVLQLAQAGKDTMEAVRRARLLYDVDVGFLDTALSRLLDRLEEEAEDFETHVVITADHGESFGEEGGNRPRSTPDPQSASCALFDPLSPARGRTAQRRRGVDRHCCNALSVGWFGGAVGSCRVAQGTRSGAAETRLACFRYAQDVG